MSDKLWQSCLQELKQEVSETSFNQWLLPLEARVQGDTLLLIAINGHFIKHIEVNYLDTITDLVKKHSNDGVAKVVLQVRQTASATEVKKEKSQKITKLATHISESDPLDPNYTFDLFVKGKSNALAYGACYEMAKKTGDNAYNFVFIYGVSGVGKSHLMQSVAHRYQKNGKKFCYLTADSFMQRVGRAFLENSIAAFQKNINEADLLIIDDIHKISPSKKPQMANVMLSLYSDFVQNGKRVILASDNPPMRMEGFDSRFLSRFSGGLTVGIDPPEMEVRVQILEKTAIDMGFELPKECAIFIAQNTSPDVRQLKGALKDIYAYLNFLGLSSVDIDVELVSSAIKSRLLVRTHSINSDRIKDMVAEYFGVSVKDLVGKKRSRQIVRPRQAAMALIREFTNDSFPDIGQAFGGRDHSTVIHACEKVAELLKEDAEFQRDYQTLSATLQYI